ncbi:MAG TPA: aminoglycoside phosphotransferase family protein [Thermomicrobiales bacterium]|nr:aminoglycoside phosphotransferase family protein [Thermomicrobiales bacterium]
MSRDPLTLHIGVPVPRQLITNVSRWNQLAVTPGWLNSLPETVAHLCSKWGIELDPVIPDPYITLVLFGHSAELGDVVIKSSPLADEFRAEATALRLSAGDKVSQLHDVDFEHSAMVVERIVPGTQLRNVPMSDEDATQLAAEMVRTFWRSVPDPAGLHPLRQWMRALFEWTPQPELIAPDLIEQAQDLAAALLAKSSRTYLLHGDVQHHNVLQRESGEWAIIDPKGLYGDPGFDIAAWMYNPPDVSERPDYLDLATRRITICANAWRMPEDELAAWAFVGTVLNACWSTSDAAPVGLLRHCTHIAQQLRTLQKQ